MISRTFVIKYFKNLGCSKKGIEIRTNYSYKFDNDNFRYSNGFSGLNILIGPNNIGKSNVLEAIKLFYSDYPDTLPDDVIEVNSFVPNNESKYTATEVSCVINDEHKKITYSKGIDYYTSTRNIYQKLTFFDGLVMEDANVYISLFENMSHVRDSFCNKESRDSKRMSDNVYYAFIDLMENGVVPNDTLIKEMGDFFLNFRSPNVSRSEKEKIYDVIKNYNKYKSHLESLPPFILDCLNPNVREFNIDTTDWVRSTRTILDKSLFYHSTNSRFPLGNTAYLVLSKIGYECNDFRKWYENIETNPSYRIEIEKEINDKLESFNDDINKSIPFDENLNRYKFVASLENNGIHLDLLCNNQMVVWEQQSTGFKWFYILYYDLFIDGGACVGDIIIMDEPCINLNPNGMKQFRSIFEKIAKRYNITFLITTHSPFLVDADYLEEVRIATEEGGKVQIYNQFNDNQVVGFEKDQFRPIMNALVTENNTIYNSFTNKVVFVEGLDDYLYFTGFKAYFKEKESKNYNLIFIPMRGANKAKSKDLIKELSKIERVSLVLLDADGAGESLKRSFDTNENNHGFYILTLGDVNIDFTDIESLFSESDRRTFKMVSNQHGKKKKPWKDFPNSSFVKKSILDGRLSQETTENFRSVLDYLDNGILDIQAIFYKPN